MFPSVLLSFLLGIAMASVVAVSIFDALFLIMIAGGLLVLGRRRNEAPPAILYIPLLLFVFSLGLIRMSYSIGQEGTSPLSPQVGSDAVFEGVVIREPEVRAKSTHLYVEIEGEIILVTTDRYRSVVYGDAVTVSGTLESPKTFTTDLGREFNYPGYLKARGVEYVISYGDVEVTEERQGNAFIAALLSIKRTLMNGIESVIPEPQAGLGEGLLLGVKQALGEELETAFRKAGIIHIVVLSGYNIMLVVAFSMYLLTLVFKPKGRLIAGLIIITSFALTVGLSATVVRASIMAGLLLIAGTFGRTYDMFRALLFAGALMVALNPYLLLYDIGFQFSFLATLGLIFFAPVFVSPAAGNRLLCTVREYVVATVATQLAVLPLLLFYMGEVSLVAVAVNLLVLPVVPLAMLGTFLSGLIALVSPLVALPFAYLTNLILSYIVIVAEWFAQLPYAVWVVAVFPWWGVFLMYALMTVGLVWYQVRKTNELRGWVIEEETETGGTLRVPPVETPVFFR
ncbi:MAG TPA: ComEC/Rec2 family competence protein [Candidatus Paceibacterota bacterium]